MKWGNFIKVICFSVLAIACSTDPEPSSPGGNGDQGGDTNQDGNGGDTGGDTGGGTVQLPRIAIVGEDKDDPSSLFLITWDDEYQTSSITDIASDLNAVNPEIYPTSIESPGSFYIRQQGSAQPAFYKYDIDTAIFQTYPQDEYFNPSATPVNLFRLANEDYIHVFYLDSDNGLEQSYYHTFNVNTGESREFPLDSVSINGLNVRITEDYAFVVFEDNFSDDYELHIFDASNGNHAIIPFDFSIYYAAMHNHLTDELYLFLNTTGCVSDYEIFDLNTFQITGSATLQQAICIPNIISPARFYGDKMLFQNLAASPAGPLTNPAIYDFSTGEKNTFDALEILLELGTITGLQAFDLIGLDADLESETIIATFAFNENGVSKGAVAFLTYDLALKQTVITDNILPKTIQFR